jgi:hypothetical protein
LISYGQAALLVVVAAVAAFYVGGRAVRFHVRHCCLCAANAIRHMYDIHTRACHLEAERHRPHEAAYPPGPPGDAHP